MRLFEKQIKNAKTKLGRVEFKYSENMSTRGDGKLWNQDRVDCFLNGEPVGRLKMDYIKPDTFYQTLPNAEAFEKYFGRRGHFWHDDAKRVQKAYKSFYHHWVNCPVVDYIQVEQPYQKQGIGYVLYIAGAMWLADKNMALHASSLQSDEAKAAWNKMKRTGLPVKTYTNKARENRVCLDFRKGFK